MVTIGQDALFPIDLVIAQGTDVQLQWRWKSGPTGAEQYVDLTGWAARGQIRQRRGGDLWLTLESGAEITLGSDGTIAVAIAHTVTEGGPWDGYTKGVWDLELTDPSGRRTRFASGTVVVSHEITTDA